MNKKIDLKKAITYAPQDIGPSIYIFNEKGSNNYAGAIDPDIKHLIKLNDEIIEIYELDENKIINSENQLLEMVEQILDKDYSIFIMYKEKWELKFSEQEKYYTKALDEEGYYGFFVNSDLSYEAGYYDIELGMHGQEEFKHLSEVSEYDPIYDKLIKAMDELDIFD